MAETIDNDECDRCDGIFKKSSEKDKRLKSKVKCNTVNESTEKKREILEEFDKMPSHPTSKKAQSHMVLEVTDALNCPSATINSSITVGEQVIIEKM